MKKLRCNRGMTLTEVLCAVLVLSLVSGLLAVGVGFAVKSYNSSMQTAQAQTLCTTLTTALSDKLRYCRTREERHFFENVGAVERLYLQDGQVMIQRPEGETEKLLGANAYPRGLRVADLSVQYDNVGRLFRVSFRVTDSSGQKTLAQAAFAVKRLAEDGNAPENLTGTKP